MNKPTRRFRVKAQRNGRDLLGLTNRQAKKLSKAMIRAEKTRRVPKRED